MNTSAAASAVPTAKSAARPAARRRRSAMVEDLFFMDYVVHGLAGLGVAALLVLASVASAMF